MKKQIILISVVGIIGVIVLAFAYNFSAENQKNKYKNEESLILLPKKAENEQKIDAGSVKTIKIGEITLNIEVANTDVKRAQGLSGKEANQNDPIGLGLGENEGMLFVFDKEGYYSFWMKDMNFPIDIAWLDKNKKIIYIEKNVSPQTYPKTFYAQKNNLPILSLYVLETKAGFFEKFKIKIGDIAEF